MLVSAGERISNALCAMVVHDLGHEAISLYGLTGGIVTDTVHGKAKIAEVRATRINEALDGVKIAFVRRVPGRLGRLARRDNARSRRLGHDSRRACRRPWRPCEIFTDVDGVFTADPRVVPDALKLPRVSYEEMLEMAATMPAS